MNAGEALTLFDNIAILTDDTGVLSHDEIDGQEAISLGGKVLYLGEFDGEGMNWGLTIGSKYSTKCAFSGIERVLKILPNMRKTNRKM